ncbi:protein root UVB sensitive 6-like [Zingiber officinale]|uniref:protein root UVB sensitive 6-like n=1 Tax=Zingiber officinale TaxID=94328 RepID=UPI001C4AAA05|nr:protein root UVB sensitive 6-like [Zingiber officinale]
MFVSPKIRDESRNSSPKSPATQPRRPLYSRPLNPPFLTLPAPNPPPRSDHGSGSIEALAQPRGPRHRPRRRPRQLVATLASPTALPLRDDRIQTEVKFGATVDPGLDLALALAALRVLCCEEIDGRRWSYVLDDVECPPGTKARKGPSLRAVPMQSPVDPLEELMSFVRSYVVPEGFPDSVTPSYVPYMRWRALKHFFGGAMGVFTTRTLLNSVGVSKNTAASGAVAINWILKPRRFDGDQRFCGTRR